MNNFNPQSYQSMTNSNMQRNNFYQGFMPNEPLINKPNFTNTGNVIHNNLGDKLFAEHSTDFQLWINSIDRNTKVYADPFHFTTIFDGVGTSTSGGTTTYGTPAPTIGRRFERVKYVNFSGVFLPRSNIFYLPANSPNSVYEMIPTGNDDLSNAHRFLILKVDELETTQIYSTNTSVITESSFVLTPNQTAGVNSVFWVACKNNSRVYPKSALGNISRLTTGLYDEHGTPITVKSRVTSGSTNTDTNYNLSADSNQANPSSELQILNKAMQLNYLFNIGTAEAELNTLTKFEH